MFLASGARASELLGMTVRDVRPGDGRIYVATKGLGGIKQACPASPEAFSWLALYLGELAGLGHRPGPGEPLWWTRRRPLRPLTYTALRALLNRINEKIGANVTAHDLRHTLCLRLVADPAITLVDAQQVMRHARITTTGLYLRPCPDEVIARVQEHYRRPRPELRCPRFSGKHSPHVLRVICGSGSAALYGEIACAGGCQGVPSMRSYRTAKAFLPCLRAVSM